MLAPSQSLPQAPPICLLKTPSTCLLLLVHMNCCGNVFLHSLVQLPLWFLRVAGTTLCLAQRTYRSISVNLLMTWEASLQKVDNTNKFLHEVNMKYFNQNHFLLVSYRTFNTWTQFFLIYKVDPLKQSHFWWEFFVLEHLPSWEVVVVGMIVVWAQGVSGSVVPVSVWAWREGQI